MSYPTNAICRAASPVSTDVHVLTPSNLTQAATVPQKFSLPYLLQANRPPFDHACYELPEKSILQQIQFVTESGTTIRLETASEARMVTREAVQDFLNDGRWSKRQSDVQALALFLLANKLFGALAWLVVQTDANVLKLDGCELGNEGAANLGEWAKTIPFKVNINLSDNGIDAKGAAQLADALEANSIVHLDLSQNQLGDEGVELICMGLKQNASLRSLNLAAVDTGNLGIQAIASVLDCHPSLTELNLNVNAFDDEAAAIFSAALGRNKILTNLFMSYVEASDAGLCIVAGALKINTALDRITLSKKTPNDLPDALAEILAQALIVNHTLTTLHLDAASVTAAAANRLAAGIAQNTTLRCFSSQFKYIFEAAAALRQIEDKLKANAAIETAGNALSDLSQRPEWTVPIPPEVGQSIAAFVAQVGADGERRAAMLTIMEAGPLGLTNPTF